MKKIYFLFYFLIATTLVAKAVDVSLTDLAGKAYGEQLKNSTFEAVFDQQNNTETDGWHSFNSGVYGGLVAFNKPKNQSSSSNQKRPGSLGNQSAKTWAGNELLGIVPNGNITTGRIYASSTTASDASKNYNCTNTKDGVYYNDFTTRPDSMTVWIRYIPSNAQASKGTNTARFTAVLHNNVTPIGGNANVYQDPQNGTSQSARYVGDASLDYGVKLDANKYVWQRLAVKFTYSTTNTTNPSYILSTFTTNKTPGEGSTKDSIIVDDILMIYNPTLSTTFSTDLPTGMINAGKQIQSFTVPYTLVGTMSPYNLNAAKNQVKVQLSDGSGSFANPTELVAVTSDVTGTLTAVIPAGLKGGEHFRYRVTTTNYPMQTPDNGSDIVINMFSLSASSADETKGTISGTTGNSLPLDQYTVTATPNSGYQTKWKNNGVDIATTGNNYTFTLNENMNIVAEFEPIPYSILYNNTKGITGITPESYTIEDAVITLPTLTPPAGYSSFEGWFDNAEFLGNAITTIPASSTGNKTFWAKWTIIDYTITYHNVAGATHTNPATYNVNTTTITLADPTKHCHTFKGWFTDHDFSNNVSTITLGSTGNLDLYAKFTLNLYTVTFKVNNNDAGIITQNAGEQSDVDCGLTITAVVEETDNILYNFTGWWSGNTKLSGSLNYPHLVTKAETIEARFVSTNKYLVNVTLSNDNAGNVSAEGLENGTGIFENSEICTLTVVENQGYLFKKWQLNGSDLSNEKTLIIDNDNTEDYVANLVAEFELIPYTITYVDASGLTNPNTVMNYNVETPTFNILNITETHIGYTFDGWFDASNVKVTQIVKGNIGDLTLTAKWTPITYNITYNHIDNATNSNVLSYNVETEVTLSNATKIGYKFDGWFDNAEFLGNAITTIPASSTGNKTFYAKWSIITYTINYQNILETDNPNTVKSYTVESETITLQPVAQDFHTFDGWFTNDAFTGTAVTQIAKGSTGDLNLYLKLTINRYPISLETNNSLGGIVRGNGYYDHGSQVTVTATANEGYKFIGWTENKEIVKNAAANYTFTVEKDRTLVANFNSVVSSNKEFAPEGLVVYAKDRQIIASFSNEIDPEVSIYLFNITGNLLSVKPCDSQEIMFQVNYVGLYFVQVGNRTVKVVVR